MQGTRSRYLRTEPENLVVRRYVARALLAARVKRLLRYGAFDEKFLRVFPEGGIDEAGLEDPGTVRRWLQGELAALEGVRWDEADPFVHNTALIGRSLDLDPVELEVMRFALVLQNVKLLDAVSDAYNASMSASDALTLLAAYLDADDATVARAFGRDSRLRRAGFFDSGRYAPHDMTNWMAVPQALRTVVFEAHADDEQVVNALFELCRAPVLEASDFEHLGTRYALVRDYLGAALGRGATGANVLLWGPPGTGKTELARLLVTELDAYGVEVANEDEDGDPVSPAGRVQQYRLCQAMLGRRERALIVYDEVEEVLSDSAFASVGLHGRAPLTKGMTNRMLETNASPAIWITNTNVGIDPAYLRRFDLVLRLDGPLKDAKRRLAARTFDGLELEPTLLDALVARPEISPAHLDRMGRICAELGIDPGEAASRAVRDMASGDLEALDARPLPRSDAAEDPDARWRLPYDATMINADLDLATLAERLGPESRARLCLSGPPGTGKTAWARHLAERTGRTLVVKRASDILGPYVGQTEQAIDRAFREAEDSGGLLLFDEVDGFVQDRAGARAHHEVQFVNQFLTSLETYRGLLVATTNLPDALDAATLRRFDFKVRLDYLRPEQVERLVLALFAALAIAPEAGALGTALERLRGLELVPGDAEVVLRRYRVFDEMPDAARIGADLAAEAAHRDGRGGRTIGFVGARR